MSPSDRVAQLYPQAPGSLFIAFYDSQGDGGGILTCLHTSPPQDIIEMNKPRMIRWAEHAAHMEKTKCAYKVLNLNVRVNF
jgi:hypothetical protein